MITLACCSLSADQASDTLKLRDTGYRQLLSDEELLKHVPETLRFYEFMGVKQRRHVFDALVVPVSDSAGLHVDSVSERPDYLFVLYNFNYTVLTVLKRQNGEYVELWSGDPMFGVLGQLGFKDVNGDGRPEVCVNLQYGSKLRPNIYYFSWKAEQLKVMSPSGKVSPLSEFRYSVDFTPSDTGSTITVRRDGVERVYFLANHSKRFRLVSEEEYE